MEFSFRGKGRAVLAPPGKRWMGIETGQRVGWRCWVWGAYILGAECVNSKREEVG